jgi:anti-anti-sigma factor
LNYLIKILIAFFGINFGYCQRREISNQINERLEEIAVELDVKHMGKSVGFKISGIVDKQGAELLEKSFRELNISALKELVLDFGKVKYVGSSGVRKLLFFYKQMTTNGGKLHIINDTGFFQELLAITKMNAVINCYGI